jgi:hypothetical protein
MGRLDAIISNAGLAPLKPALILAICQTVSMGASFSM